MLLITKVTIRTKDQRLIIRRSVWEKLRLEELSHRPHEGMCSRAFDSSFDGFKPRDSKHSHLSLTVTVLCVSEKTLYLFR